MTGRFASLSGRERRLVLLAGMLLLAAMIFQFGYLPLRAWRLEAARDLAAARAMLEGVEARADRLAQLTGRVGTPPPANADLLRQAVASQAQARGIALSRLVPEADGGLSVAIERSTAEPLFAWLVALDREAGARVSRASIAGDAASGTLRAQLRFAGGGGG